MSDCKPLTVVQRRILWLMRHFGTTTFIGRTRSFYWGRFEEAGGIVIQAYMQPELWLEYRGLIEHVQSNHPGRWYRLTANGQQKARRLRERPPGLTAAADGFDEPSSADAR